MRSITLAVLGYFIVSGSAQGADFTCPKPITIPDRWNDVNQNGIFDPGIDVYDPLTTGYSSANPGLRLVLVQATLISSTAPGMYFPVDFPALNRGNPLSGSEVYQQWWLECSPFFFLTGDTLVVESGMKQGPTLAAVTNLITQDPTAYWDGDSQSVISPFQNSPRIVTVFGFDPNAYAQAGRSNVVISKFIQMFIESVGPGSALNVKLLGATTDPPVPTQRMTWGKLKGRY